MFYKLEQMCYNGGEKGERGMERTIFHCDLNCFYASVELLFHPELRHLPVAVCGDPAIRHGIVLAKNEVAKRRGVKSAEAIWQARRKCPELVTLPAHHDLYWEYSQRVNAIYADYTDLIEPFGIDESWLDVTGTLHLFGGDDKALADRIRARVREELGLTISVGVSYNKALAKLGSDYKKPDATTVIRPEDLERMVWPLPLGDLLFAGRAAERELSRYGVKTIGDLARFDRGAIERLLGRSGLLLHDYANGRDPSRVHPAGEYVPPKSVSRGRTFPEDIAGERAVRSAVTALADDVACRLRRHALRCTTVQVRIRNPQFHDVLHQKHMSAPSFLADEIARCAMELIRAGWDLTAPVRAITVSASGLVPEQSGNEQLDLFADGEAQRRRRRETLAHTVDALRGAFGDGIVRPASSIRIK